ncbi:MAG: 2OG-Fe(II) oxygenase [Pontixanthobacter sp.]
MPGIRRFPSPKIELFQHPRFLSAQTCGELTALIDRDRRPSTIADDNGDAAFRTSETCDLPTDNAAVRAVEEQLERLNGIDPAFGEPLQGQRYAIGKEFKPHTDYFTPGGADYERYCAVAGQRSWTFMMYLNAPQAGGGTRFKHLGKTVQPEIGKLLCWNNRLADGGVNPATLHHGMKVRRGTKYVLTKWYREKEWK